MTAWDVMRLIAKRNDSPFQQKRNWLTIPNVSFGFLRYEADMLVVSRAKYCTEIEVKVSMQDWKADFAKQKHKNIDKRIKYQYYACPLKLAERHTELELPSGWGVIGVDDSKGISILKPATPYASARKINDKELMTLARLVCFRIWRLGEP